MSLICTKFDPSNTYLASCQVSLDTHQVKVQSINTSQSTLNISFNLDKTSKVTNLSWVVFEGTQLIALCLTRGAVLLYSPLTNSIVSELTTSLNLSMLDFHYSSITKSAWSCDIGGNVYEWDLLGFRLIQNFQINDHIEISESIHRISTILYGDKPHLLLGSHAVYLMSTQEKQIVKTFPGHVQTINNIYPITSDNDLFLTSAKGDRFMNLYSLSKNSTKSVFVSESSVVEMALGLKGDKSILVVINENNNLEIFNNPLTFDTPQETTASTSRKKRRQQGLNVQSRSSNANVKLSRPQSEIKSPVDANLGICNISFQDNLILFSWLENFSYFTFDTLRWLDDSGEFLLDGSKVIEKHRETIKTASHSAHGHDIASKKEYNEGNAIISDGTNFRNLESDSEDEETLADKLEKLTTDQKSKKESKSKKRINKSSTGTLTIILAQSLRNNDHALLETVLGNRDSNVIKNTISKLDSALAVSLLDRLSERIQRQPSRFNELNFWLKWIIIIHGGVLSSMPNLSPKLANLHSILHKKSSTLPRLLELQGRLNMTYQQNDLKREILNGEYDDKSDENESDVEYVEELDDAEFLGLDEDDESVDMNGVDDYVFSDDEINGEVGNSASEDSESDDEDEDDADGNVASVMDLEAEEDEEDNYSDMEIDVKSAKKK